MPRSSGTTRCVRDPVGERTPRKVRLDARGRWWLAQGSKAADQRYLPLTPDVLAAHLTGTSISVCTRCCRATRPAGSPRTSTARRHARCLAGSHVGDQDAVEDAPPSPSGAARPDRGRPCRHASGRGSALGDRWRLAGRCGRRRGCGHWRRCCSDGCRWSELLIPTIALLYAIDIKVVGIAIARGVAANDARRLRPVQPLISPSRCSCVSSRSLAPPVVTPGIQVVILTARAHHRGQHAQPAPAPLPHRRHRRRLLPNETGQSEGRNTPQDQLNSPRRVGTFSWPPVGTATWPLTPVAIRAETTRHEAVANLRIHI